MSSCDSFLRARIVNLHDWFSNKSLLTFIICLLSLLMKYFLAHVAKLSSKLIMSLIL